MNKVLILLCMLSVAACGGDKTFHAGIDDSVVGQNGTGSALDDFPNTPPVPHAEPYQQFDYPEFDVFYKSGSQVVYTIPKNRMYVAGVLIMSKEAEKLEQGNSFKERCSNTRKRFIATKPEDRELYFSFLKRFYGLVIVNGYANFNSSDIVGPLSPLIGIPQHKIDIRSLPITYQIHYPESSFIEWTLNGDASERSKYEERFHSEFVYGFQQKITLAEMCDLVSDDFRLSFSSNIKGIDLPSDSAIRFEDQLRLR